MSGVAEKIHGIGLGLKAVFGALLADDAPAAGGGSTAQPPAEAITTRLCRKPHARGWHCYERDGHPGGCNLERDEDGAP